MLHAHFSNLLVKELGYAPTPDQQQIIVGLGQFLTEIEPDSVFLIRGYAGTGKTTVIASIVKVLKSLKQQVILMAPTGRAAKVLSSYSGEPASTIHRKIYRQKGGGDFESAFDLDRNLHQNATFIVDEASMIGDSSTESSAFGSGNLLRDLIDYVNSGHNCKLILSGDVAQLPPVGIALSPALREGDLQSYGKKATVFTLRDVIRQAQDSGILYNATNIRTKLAQRNYDLPLFNDSKFPDFKSISGSDFGEILETKYNEYGIDQVAVITRTNKLANTYNNGIRQSILWHENELVSNDLLMVVKNNYFWVNDKTGQKFIANGDIIRLSRVRNFSENYGFRFADATIILSDDDASEIDVKVLLDTLTSPSAGLTNEQNRALYLAVEADYAEIKNRRKRYLEIRNNPFFNAIQIKYAYAITCHKSQGGQWSAVFVDQGYFTDEMLNVEYFRWLYTAVTRAKTELYLVNFKEQFFEA
ncbi:MAG: AAA family ATPase [Salinivirgaceae bacterium]|nr:AAA family ATPase [Salinivirgaceae bacterium]MDD4747951.1 AAA family ATPase [Salinivirgaceae bacterium]